MSGMRFLLTAACIAGGTAVILGAFGAHALKGRLTPESLASFETGVRYQMFHALALFAAAWLAERTAGGLPLAAGALWSIGILLFSGSIYLLATRALFGIEGWRWLGPVTPLGGLCLIAGWIVLLIAVVKR
ncbi:MAG TPA: DUF423 domain-containing protein [Kiritimatiellia bacterium]|nr:DUF423 domain-containing protein [Kiritimatiellia bacterium]